MNEESYYVTGKISHKLSELNPMAKHFFEKDFYLSKDENEVIYFNDEKTDQAVEFKSTDDIIPFLLEKLEDKMYMNFLHDMIIQSLTVIRVFNGKKNPVQHMNLNKDFIDYFNRSESEFNDLITKIERKNSMVRATISF